MYQTQPEFYCFNIQEFPQLSQHLSQLPATPGDWISQHFDRFIKLESMAGVVLILTATVALTLANSRWSAEFSSVLDTNVGVQVGETFQLTRPIRGWINDGLMTFFFFLIALELKREFILGELRIFRIAALPVAAAVGGMLVPAGFFLLIIGSHPGAGAWGVVMSTDTALVVVCLVALGRRIPQSLRVFLLSLAIIDDVGAILVVAIGYGDGIKWLPVALAAASILILTLASKIGIRSFAVFTGLGMLCWIAVDASGFHATLVGILLGFMTPSRSWVSDRRLHAILEKVTAYPLDSNWTDDPDARRDLSSAGVAAKEAISPIERLEAAIHPWVAFGILPLFALANAGFVFNFDSSNFRLAIATFLGFVVGKPVGVMLFSFFVVKAGFADKPQDLSWLLLSVGSLLTGVGFSMALLIADLASTGDELTAIRLGILTASILSGGGGIVALWILSRLELVPKELNLP